MKKKITLVLILVMLLVCLLPACGQTTTDEDETEATSEKNLLFMSYNVRYNGDDGALSANRRVPRIIDRIWEYMPDVIGMQEAQPIHNRALQEEFEEVYDMVFTYRQTMIPFVNSSPESCPILYKKDKFELLDTGAFWLSETPDVESKMQDAGHYRICSWVHLREKTEGYDFYYYNTHLDTNRSARAKSIPVLLSRLPEGQTVIVGGDMNFDPTEEEYDMMTAELTDSRVTVGTDTTVTTFHDYSPAEDNIGRHIDFLFYRGDVEAKTHTVVCNDEEIWGEGNYASDHYPVFVSFAFGENK